MDRDRLRFTLGKSGSNNEGHPLLCHMLDTAAVARTIWDQALDGMTRQRLAIQLDTSPEQTRSWVFFLAGLHDLGKASPAFQLVTLSKLEGHAAKLAANGLREPRPRHAWHGPLTAKGLAPILVTDFGCNRRVATQLSDLLGGHHGRFPGSSQIDNIELEAEGDEQWRALREEHVVALARTLDIELNPLSAPLKRSGAMILAGLVSVADWIASNTDYFPSHVGPLDAAAYWTYSQEQAVTALNELGWVGFAEPRTDPLTFNEVFGFSPRPVQLAAAELADVMPEGGLTVLEVPMGEGKTEAALYLADRWSIGRGHRGLYLALPTQATSDQMFGRLTRALRRRYPSEDIQLQLLHGHSSLSAEFELLRRNGDRLFKVRDLCGTDDEPGDVLASTWFTGRKHGLLAPFGVGTIDQALLSALVTPHVFVRLFGLAGKTIVFDEVHAYDTYQTTLTERLLEWCGALGSSVVLLSATLPDDRRRLLLSAYARGGGWDVMPDAIPGAAYPRISWTSAASTGARHVETSPTSTRQLGVRWVAGEDPGELAEVIARSADDGGCVAVICNTVARAQAVFAALRTLIPGNAEDGEPIVDLLHARFPAEERAQRQERILRRFGPAVGSARPRRAVVVATQIIEQSLDIDFDAMFSDIAPIDLLLQRSGRLHRHHDLDAARPREHRAPVLQIVRPSLDGDQLQFERGTTYVYDDHTLFRTWLALSNVDEVAIPGDVEELIEAVYSTMTPPRLSEPAAQRWQTSLKKRETDAEKERGAAEARVLKPPQGPAFELAELTGHALHEDGPDLHKALRALTRYDADNVMIVCLYGSEDAATLDSAGLRPIAVRSPEGHTTRELLSRSLSLSTKGLIHAIRAQPAPNAWKDSALLRDCRPVYFDAAGLSIVATDKGSDWELRLDFHLGLQVVRVQP